MSTVGIVCVHYHPHYVGPTLGMLARVVEGLDTCATVHVANQASVGDTLNASGLGPSCEVIGHDNSGLEFGGYQAGLDRLRQIADPDWVLVVNDTFATHDHFATPYRARLRGELFGLREHGTIVGQVDSSARSYRLAGLRTHRWVRSNVFALNRAAIAVLGARLYVPELDASVVDTTDPAAFFGPAVDPVLSDRLQNWLFRPHGVGLHWYAAQPLGASNSARMARKARSILQEKFLSARLEEAGAEFADVRDIGVAGRARRTIENKLFEARRRPMPAPPAPSA